MASEPRFEIGPRLGAGGMGVVYEALDREQGKRVALKRLARVGPLEIHQLKREFRSLADVVHPNLVRLHELLTADDGEPFFTMELVLGVDFLAYVRRGVGAEEATVSLTQALRADAELPARSETRAGAVDIPRLRHALGQLALGLAALHRAGKVHRDLKPSNVMVHDDGRLVILDFGLVRSRRRDDAESEPLIGTAAYMAPEQVTGARPSPASDWYSFGVMLYEALTGRCPYEGALGELLRRKLAEDPPHPLSLAPEAPADLADLAARLLARRPDARPTEAEVLAALGVDAPSARLGDSLDAFVGREAESRALAEALDDVRAGRSVTVHVAGQSGMGKTALVERVLDDLADARDVLVLRGRCFERETVPYKTVDGLVDALAQHLTSLERDERAALLPPDAAALARVFPALLRVPAIADAADDTPVVQDDQELRRRGFLALKQLLAALGQRRTLVLAIDDLQWGDLDGARVLIELRRPPDAPRLLLVGSYRSEEASRSACVTALLTEAREHGVWHDTRHVALGALTQVEAFELALTALSAAGRPLAELDGLAASIAAESDGSPFYVWELAHAALRGGREDVTLTELLEERIRGLEAGAQRLLEVVAIAGGPVAQQLVAQVAESPEPRDALAMLRSQRLVRARGLSDADTVEAYHDRVRETVLAALDPARRRELHRRVAGALEARGGGDPEQLAEHWGRAGEGDRAAELAVIAGDRAAHALAFERAARLYALALQRSRLDPAQRRELERRRGEALANAGRGAEAAAALLRAADRDGQDGRDAGALELRRRAAEQLLSSGHIDEGLEVLDGVLSRLGVWLPSSPRLALASLLVGRAELALRGTRFEERPEAAVSAEERLRIDACWALTVGLNGVDMIRGADFATRTLLLSLKRGDSYRIGRALAFETTTNAFVGATRRAKAEALAAELRGLAERLGSPHLRGFALLVTGMCDAFAAGRWTSALGWYAQAERVFRDECSGVPWEVATTDMVTAWSLFYTGRVRELSARLPATLSAAEQRRDLYAQANLTTSTTWVMLAADDVAGARAYPVAVMARWSRTAFHLQHYVALLAETHVDRYDGRGVEAYDRFARSFGALEGSQLLRAQANRIVAHYERGLSAIAAADEAPARAAQLTAVARADAASLEAERVAWATPFALLIRAGARAVLGDPDGAAALLVRAECAFDACDMRLYAASARRQRGRLTGGARGRELVESADARMRDEDIEEPARWAAMLAPGFDRVALE